MWKSESWTPDSKLLCLWFYINKVPESGTEMSYMEVHGLPVESKALRYVPRLLTQSAQRYRHPCTSLNNDQKWSIYLSLLTVPGAFILQWSHAALPDGAGSQLMGGHAHKRRPAQKRTAAAWIPWELGHKASLRDQVSDWRGCVWLRTGVLRFSWVKILPQF